MNDELIEFFKESLKIFKKKEVPQKVIIKIILDEIYENAKLTTIWVNNEIKSEFKNDIFDQIIVDEDGEIIDLQIYSHEPTLTEIIGMTHYWIELFENFNREVKPYIYIYRW